MFVKIIAPNGEFKREGFSIRDYVESDRELFLNLSAVGSIHVIGKRLYFDRLRLTFENEAAAQNAINALLEAMRNNGALIELSRGLVTVTALSGCEVPMINGCVGEAEDGPSEADQDQNEGAEQEELAADPEQIEGAELEAAAE